MTAATHDDGIYFDLPEAEYHADPALGASGICDLLVSPIQYWRNSPHNIGRKDEDTPAKLFGSYFHALLAREAGAYAIKPEGMNFATNAGKAWRDAPEQAGKQFISEADAGKALLMLDALETAGVMQAFEDTASEVSVFWTPRDGIRRKARFDRWGPAGAVDWKTFSNPMGKDADTAIAHAVAYNRYHIRAVHYDDAAQAAHILAGKPKAITGSEWQRAQCAAVAAQSFPPPLWFVFIEADTYPGIVVRRFTKHSEDGAINGYWRDAVREIERAEKTYRLFMERYGASKPWIEPAIMRPFGDDDFLAARWIVANE